MRKFFAVAMGSLVALAGFAGVANASATVDLVWIDISTIGTDGKVTCLKPAKRNCPILGSTLSGAATTDLITLGVLVTAGANSLLAAGVDVDFRDAQPKLALDGFQAFTTTRPFEFFPLQFGDPFTLPEDEGWVQFFTANALVGVGADVGLGLPAGATAYLGTVTFHKDSLINGTFDLIVNTDGPNSASDIIRLDGGLITATTTFNSATLVNVPEPGALSLLVMGLGGMLLAGRGRRS